jgi:uncharacterized membrane protein
MARITASVTIDCPVEIVFDFTVDQSQLAKWQTGMIDSQIISSDTTGAGLKYRYTFETYGRKFVSTGVITDFVPNCRYSFKTLSGKIPISGEYRFETIRGRTRVTFSGEMAMGGFGRLIRPFVTSAAEAHFKENLRRLKAVLEP